MVDKRFWTVAIAAVTIAVAGAGALPSLLLAPASPDLLPIPPVAAAPSAPPKAEPVATPVQSARAEPPTAIEAKPAPTPPPAAVPATPNTPEPVKAAEHAKAPEPVREVAAPTFPPVQPIGIPAKPPETAAARLPAQTPAAIEASGEPEKAKRATRPQHAAERPRRVRPAPYPMREFLAWRR